MEKSGSDQILIGCHMKALLKMQVEGRQTHTGICRQRESFWNNIP